MSDFDSNPFADPHSSPFQDPSVQQATANSSRGLEEFNPFEDNNRQTNTQVPAPVPSQSTQPAVVSTTKDTAPPAYTPSSAQSASTLAQEDLLKRQAELEEKAAELQRREQQLRSAQYNIRENNFPPLPKWFPIGPCFYQDFAVDIPVSFQRIVKMGFYLWLGYSLLLFANVFIAAALFFSAARLDKDSTFNGNGGTIFGVSLLYLLFFPALSYVCWFRPLYKAFRSDSSFNFFLFFFVFFFQCIYTTFLALGVTNGGACGLIVSIEFVGQPGVGRKIIGALMLLLTALFFTLLAAEIYYLVQVHRLYRSTGASFEKAQQEFAKNVATNPGVQSATKQAASAAVSGAMSGALSGNQSGNQM